MIVGLERICSRQSEQHDCGGEVCRCLTQKQRYQIVGSQMHMHVILLQIIRATHGHPLCVMFVDIVLIHLAVHAKFQVHRDHLVRNGTLKMLSGMNTSCCFCASTRI